MAAVLGEKTLRTKAKHTGTRTGLTQEIRGIRGLCCRWCQIRRWQGPQAPAWVISVEVS